MFPGIDGFHWDTGHVVFLGAFFCVLLLVASTLLRAALRSLRDATPARVEKVRWHSDFADLALDERCCRHEVTGEIASRTCRNEFDCRGCTEHPKFLAAHGAAQPSRTTAEVGGILLPLDRFYHRGHTWARLESDGAYTIGLDELAEAAIGQPDSVDLPAAGSQVFVNGTAWTVRKGEDTVRILSPVDGEVLESGVDDGECRLRVRPAAGFRATHLLAGNEAVRWFRREFERLQAALGDPSVGSALADGGELVADLEKAYPKTDWQAVRGAMFLEP